VYEVYNLGRDFIMAFSYTIENIRVKGSEKHVRGTFTNTDSSTGGDIETGLSLVKNMVLQHTGSSVVESAPVVNETLPLSSGTVTIVTIADADGTWEAVGK
jgi:hypothetical protein